MIFSFKDSQWKSTLHKFKTNTQKIINILINFCLCLKKCLLPHFLKTFQLFKWINKNEIYLFK